MPSVVITPPEPIVSLDEAKAQVRFSAADDDLVLTDIVAAATAYLDGPDGLLSRAIGSQTIRQTWPCFPSYHGGESFLTADVGPIVELVGLTYLDDAGARQTLDVAALAFDETRVQSPDGGWPSMRPRLGGVILEYSAGYETVPPALKRAVLLMVGTLYANREASPDSAFSGALQALVAPFARVA